MHEELTEAQRQALHSPGPLAWVVILPDGHKAAYVDQAQAMNVATKTRGLWIPCSPDLVSHFHAGVGFAVDAGNGSVCRGERPAGAQG